MKYLIVFMLLTGCSKLIAPVEAKDNSPLYTFGTEVAIHGGFYNNCKGVIVDVHPNGESWSYGIKVVRRLSLYYLSTTIYVDQRFVFPKNQKVTK